MPLPLLIWLAKRLASLLEGAHDIRQGIRYLSKLVKESAEKP